jgi:hypothetical protein
MNENEKLAEYKNTMNFFTVKPKHDDSIVKSESNCVGETIKNNKKTQHKQHTYENT